MRDVLFEVGVAGLHRRRAGQARELDAELMRPKWRLDVDRVPLARLQARQGRAQR